jgi:hypothetical protein
MQGLYPPVEEGEKLTIVTGSVKAGDPLIPLFGPEDDFGDNLHAFIKQEPLASRVPEAKRLYGGLFDHYNITSRTDLDYVTIGDLFFPYRCGNGALGEIVDDELLERMLRDLLGLEYEYAATKLALSYIPIKNVIVKEIEAQLSGRTNARFGLLSGHDVTLVAFLAGRGYRGLEIPPPYASHLALEIWQNGCCMFVRIVYNGKVIEDHGRELIPLPEFLENEGEQEL